jgi:energy-coupling factor transporter ATP-binding protein EcfA2
MLTPEQKQWLKAFHNNLEDTALVPTDPRYVAVFSDENDPAKEDPIRDIATNISLAASASVNLLSGPRGSGKSTELKRLSHILKTEEQCTVFYCDMSEYMNMTTAVDITDFLISMMTALNDAVEQKYQTDLKERRYSQRLRDFLQNEVKVDSVTVKTFVGDIKGNLKSDPSFKVLLQQQLKGHVGHIVKQAHQFAAEVVAFIRKQSGNPAEKVVLLIDSLEKVRGEGEEAALVYKSMANLFSSHAADLQFGLLHILYTIPPYMAALLPGVGRSLGGHPVQTLPSVHVRQQDNQDDPEGLNTMLEMVSKRSEHLDKIFKVEQIHQLARLSGGDLRNFFRFLSHCLVKSLTSAGFDLPVAQPLLEQAINLFRREILLPGDDKDWLIKINQSGDHHLLNQEDLPRFIRFLDAGLVLNYRNGSDWYGVNPLIQDALKQPADGD